VHPVLFEIGDFPVRTFGLLLALGALVGILMAVRRAPRYGLPPERIWDLCFWLILAGVLGARALFVLIEWRFYSENPGELLRLRFDGLTSFGGLLGGALAAWVWTRRTGVSLVTVVDTLAVPFLVAHAIGRIGCLMNGCCYGHPVAGFPGVHFPGAPDGHALHQPAQLYEMAMVLAGAWWISRRERLGLAPGQPAALMMVAYGLSRFVYEFFRIGTTSTPWGALPVTEAHAAAFVMALAGSLWYGFAERRRRELAAQG
jgi:phosphatidylglycerol:prolipoprotein diacylglycerol transferase